MRDHSAGQFVVYCLFAILRVVVFVMSQELKKFGFIDGFRGWAALGVVFVHSQGAGNPPDWIKPLMYSGARGVQLFFIISAFTLFYSLTTRSQYDKRPITAFFVRRFFRIAPLFYAVMLYSLYCGSSGPSYWAPNGVSGLGVFLTSIFMNGWYPDFSTSIVQGGWTIAVEMNFYLLLPLLFMKIRKIWIALICIPITWELGQYIASKFAAFYRPLYNADNMYVLDAWQHILSLPSELYVFFFGIFTFLLWYRCQWIFEIFQKKTYSKILVFLLGCLIAAIYLKPSMFLIVFLLSCIVLVGSSVDSPLIQGKVIRFVGKISYSLYFFHFFAYGYIGKVSDGFFPWLGSFALNLAISIPAAFIGYSLIEKPFQRIGKGLIAKYIN